MITRRRLFARYSTASAAFSIIPSFALVADRFVSRISRLALAGVGVDSTQPEGLQIRTNA